MSTDFHYSLFLAFLIIAAVAVFWIPSTPTPAELQQSQTCPYQISPQTCPYQTDR